jgi:CheY-like chemotaxis protein
MSAETKTIRILAADDHALLRQGIASLIDIEPDMELVAQAATGREAIEQFRRHQPDITLMDLQMPDMSGMEAIIAIRGEFPNARIIVFTTYVGDVQVMRALKSRRARLPAEGKRTYGSAADNPRCACRTHRCGRHRMYWRLASRGCAACPGHP